MNPPSALHGAMNRDRKPFTYTPGGLDLSEIKSERMAKRLMRNAMNEGVPQQPVQQIQSPPATSVAVNNFNFSPVQVFPAFNLPANPKSLLRTRSNPVSREPPLPRAESQKKTQYDTFSNKNTPSYSQKNNNKPTSVFEYSAAPFMNYESNTYNTCPAKDEVFPEICYDAQYFQTAKTNDKVENFEPLKTLTTNESINNSQSDTKEVDLTFQNVVAHKDNKAIDEKEVTPTINLKNDYEQVQSEEFYTPPADKVPILEFKPEATASEVILSVPEYSMPIPEDVGYSTEQKQVKIITKESKKETKTEEQNGDQNGDTAAVVTMDLPPAPVVSSAKKATKVEISKKTLPDGSVEEVKKTITTTTIDGKTEIKTKTETTIIPKDDEEEEEVEEEEEEEEIQEENEKPVTVTIKSATQVKENGQDNIIKTEERSETTTTSTKKVVIVQNDEEEENEQEEEVEEEEVEEAEPITVVLKKPSQPAPPQGEAENESEAQIEEDEEKQTVIEEVQATQVLKSQEKVESEEEVEEIKKAQPGEQAEVEEVVEEDDEEEQDEEVEEKEIKIEKESENNQIAQKVVDEESEQPEKEVEVEETEKVVNDNEVISETSNISVEETKALVETEIPVEKPAPVEVEIPIIKEFDDKQVIVVEKVEQLKHVVAEETKTEKLETPETSVPLREPSVPLEKVEEVEIRPIGAGNIIRKTSTETTEIITGVPDKPTGLLTEFNRTENIVTVNRTTKTLEYENAQPQTIPTLTYFTPHIEKFPPSPQPTHRPYQPVYPSEPTSERRHSLLLERLSVERQIPTSEIYQNTQQYSQTIEQQNQWGQEPRVEILTVENVKPSSITNQQWYQQSEKKDVIYNNVAQAPPVAPSWTQPKQQHPVYEPPSQPAYQSSSQPAYQAPPQPTYQPQPSYQATKPAYQPASPQPAYQTQPQYQAQPQTPQYQPQSQTPLYQTQSQTPQYQPQSQTPQYNSYNENLQQNTSSQQDSYTSQQYSTYTPKPAYTPGTQTQYTDSYQSQKLSASYVPPPWEQDSTYVVDNSQNYYQPAQQTTFTPDMSQSWESAPASKFNKTPPKAYIPPKPNQSFVKHVTIAEPPKQPGRKTYYSEYERRYISVPESTYIPGETKPQPQSHVQAQPDPSPAYYYDNNEPAEQVEHEWRKELREFAEKSQTQPTNVQPPWETSTQTKTSSQYAKTQETTYTATPTWSQTLRPQSWRERSFESEFVSQESPKTSTLGRGRPMSSYGRESSISERTRGVSVDRYNPNSYQSPVPEPHPPVQTFTHTPPAPHGPGYHNPNVPAYHASRASAEPREQPVYQQPKQRVDTRASPFQSRSFKYLQWITGTED